MTKKASDDDDVICLPDSKNVRTYLNCLDLSLAVSYLFCRDVWFLHFIIIIIHFFSHYVVFLKCFNELSISFDDLLPD